MKQILYYTIKYLIAILLMIAFKNFIVPEFLSGMLYIIVILYYLHYFPKLNK